MKHYEIYSILFISSLLMFLINFLIQGPLVFTYYDDYGIILKMNWIYWIGYSLLLILICFQYHNFEKINNRYSYLTLFLLALYLIATTFFYEKLPRFEDTWSHSFLAQEILRNKKVNIGLSIYEEYPGSFIFFGTMFEFIPKYYVLKFFPPLFFVFGLLSIYLLTKNNLLNDKIALLTPVIYMLFNWTIEDNHISPQFLNLHLYFFLMLVLIKLLTTKNNKIQYLFIISLFAASIVFSHPLTPLFLISILGSILILSDKIRKKILPVFVIIIAFYLTYEIYRSTTFFYIVDYLKNFFQILLSGPSLESATSRFSGLSFLNRQIIFGSKVFLTVFSIIFGVIGSLALHKKRFVTAAKFFFAWSFSMILFIIIMSQIVEGEFYERFILISSLPLGFLTAYSLEQRKSKISTILILLLILSIPYFLSKHGNESYQSESLEKLKTDCFLHTFSTNCEEEHEIVPSPLNWDIKNLGESHFGISREEIMASSIYNDKDLDSVLNLIEKQSETNKLDRIYSTDETAAYIKN